ncbi:MAG: lipid asymmetry maintenance protein MlaB [Candidatus Omnitrophota bacterium]
MKIKGVQNNVIVEGNLIFDNAKQLKDGLLAKLEKFKKDRSDKEVGIDLSRIEEIDSSGIQLLIAFFKSLQKHKIQYKIIGMNDETVDVLELAGLNKFFKYGN